MLKSYGKYQRVTNRQPVQKLDASEFHSVSIIKHYDNIIQPNDKNNSNAPRFNLHAYCFCPVCLTVMSCLCVRLSSTFKCVKTLNSKRPQI